jgi:hypothetical protein
VTTFACVKLPDPQFSVPFMEWVVDNRIPDEAAIQWSVLSEAFDGQVELLDENLDPVGTIDGRTARVRINSDGTQQGEDYEFALQIRVTPPQVCGLAGELKTLRLRPTLCL